MRTVRRPERSIGVRFCACVAGRLMRVIATIVIRRFNIGTLISFHFWFLSSSLEWWEIKKHHRDFLDLRLAGWRKSDVRRNNWKALILSPVLDLERQAACQQIFRMICGGDDGDEPANIGARLLPVHFEIVKAHVLSLLVGRRALQCELVLPGRKETAWNDQV